MPAAALAVGSGSASLAEQNLAAAVAAGEGEHRVECLLGHDDDHRVLVGAQILAMAQEHVMRDRRGDNGHVLEQDAVLLSEGVRVDRRVLQGRKARDDIDPRVGGRERHLGRDDDAVGAVGVGDLVEVVTRELEHLRARFHGGHLEPDDVAAIPQAAPPDRPDATRAAGHELDRAVA
jgi:hypothetical protein